MKIDTAIINGKLVRHDGIFEQVVVGISGEKIVFVGGNDYVFDAKKVIDARGNYILPGIIDIHSHFADLYSYEDDVLNETKAAAAGGITTVSHFFTGLESVYQRIPHYKETTNRLATVDMVFHTICTTDIHLDEIHQCREVGIKGFKFFTHCKGGEMEVYGIGGTDLSYLYRGMEIVKKVGGIVQVHVENYELLQLFKERHIHQNDFYSFNLSRPPIIAEIDAYAVCSMAEKVGCSLYIVHTGAGNILDIARHFRARKNEVYIETCPRFLLIDDKGTGLKRPELATTFPAYYPKADNERMWEGLATGEVDSIGTDSAIFSYKDKIQDGVVWNMFPGWQEMPTLLTTMLSEGVNKNRITLPRLVTLMSYNPAKIFGIYPRKGELLPGSDADITLVDLDKKQKVRAELFPSAGDFTPYEDWELKGWPILTMVRGKVIMEEGRVLDAVGWGKAVNLG